MHFIRSLWTIHSHIVDFQHQQIGAPLNPIRLGFESLLGFHEALERGAFRGCRTGASKGQGACRFATCPVRIGHLHSLDFFGSAGK